MPIMKSCDVINLHSYIFPEAVFTWCWIQFHSGTASSRYCTEYLYSFLWYWIQFHSVLSIYIRLHDTGSSFIPVRLHPGSILSINIRLHDAGSSFIPVRLHPGSIPSIYIRLHHAGSSFIPVRLHPGSVLSIYIRLHDTGSSFIPVRPHPGSILSIYIRLHDTGSSFILILFVYMIPTKISWFRNESFQNEFIPVVAPNRNFRSGTKYVHTFHKHHVKEVGALPVRNQARGLVRLISWLVLSIRRCFYRIFIPER